MEAGVLATPFLHPANNPGEAEEDDPNTRDLTITKLLTLIWLSPGIAVISGVNQQMEEMSVNLPFK